MSNPMSLSDLELMYAFSSNPEQFHRICCPDHDPEISSLAHDLIFGSHKLIVILGTRLDDSQAVLDEILDAMKPGAPWFNRKRYTFKRTSIASDSKVHVQAVCTRGIDYLKGLSINRLILLDEPSHDTLVQLMPQLQAGNKIEKWYTDEH